MFVLFYFDICCMFYLIVVFVLMGIKIEELCIGLF